MRSLLLALLVVVCRGWAPPPAPARAFASRRTRRSVIGDGFGSELADRLPLPPFAGTAPAALQAGREIQLEEREDRDTSLTALVLNADGTVGMGQTDGPPPVAASGLWQAGATEFQMTLRRDFEVSPSGGTESGKPGPIVNMLVGDTRYSVTRCYVGECVARSAAQAAVAPSSAALQPAPADSPLLPPPQVRRKDPGRLRTHLLPGQRCRRRRLAHRVFRAEPRRRRGGRAGPLASVRVSRGGVLERKRSSGRGSVQELPSEKRPVDFDQSVSARNISQKPNHSITNVVLIKYFEVLGKIARAPLLTSDRPSERKQ